MMLRTALVLLICVTDMLARKPASPEKGLPPAQPISFRIEGKRELVLDRGGRTAAAFRKEVMSGKFTPSPLSCDLKLRITNNTKETIRVRTSGGFNRLEFNLKGKGGTQACSRALAKRHPIKQVVLKPGESHSLPFTELAGFDAMRLQFPVPLEAGEYELTASFTTEIYSTLPGVGGRPKRFIEVPPGLVAVKAGRNGIPAPAISMTVKVK